VSSDEFTAFYVRAKDGCLRAAVASGMRPGEAEEAVAEAFARAWASWGKVRTTSSPAAWVVRTAINANISSWRKRRREVSVDGVREAVVDGWDSSTDVVAAVRQLPPRQREVVVLRYLLDLDTATTAEVLGIARGTVAAHLHHALANLRARLTHYEGAYS